MTREEALEAMRIAIESGGDPEASHYAADGILCKLLISLGYQDVVDLWKDVDKWYA